MLNLFSVPPLHPPLTRNPSHIPTRDTLAFHRKHKDQMFPNHTDAPSRRRNLQRSIPAHHLPLQPVPSHPPFKYRQRITQSTSSHPSGPPPSASIATRQLPCHKPITNLFPPPHQKLSSHPRRSPSHCNLYNLTKGTCSRPRTRDKRGAKPATKNCQRMHCKWPHQDASRDPGAPVTFPPRSRLAVPPRRFQNAASRVRPACTHTPP